MATSPDRRTQWHIGVAAEAIAAARFALEGYDVSVQYGANQPEYDLMVARGQNMLRVSVKGSTTGSWGLTQGLLRNGKYHEAIEAWVARHKSGTVFCFVQFKGVDNTQMPRLYLATPHDVGQQLASVASGLGGTILYEHHVWKRPKKHKAIEERIPISWTFSGKRIDDLLDR